MISIRTSFAAAIACCSFSSAALAETAPAAPAAEQAAPAPSSAPPNAAAAPSAEPTPSAPAPISPTIYVAQPPLPPLEPRSRHFHDGFYLRLSIGFGALGVSSGSSKPGFDSTASGSGGAIDLLVGGTPAPGLVIGGGVLVQEAFKPTYSENITAVGPVTFAGTSRSGGSLGFGMLGPMIDAFPNPSGGFHVGGLIGLSQVGLNDTKDKPSTGVGLSVWAGYLWWASSQWSLGGLVRLSAAWSGRTLGADPNQFDVTDTTRAFTLMFSTAYH